MEHFMEKHKSLKNGIIKIYGLRIQKLERKLQDLLYKDSDTRIREFIMDYVRTQGETNNGSINAKNLLTHKDIANLTNTSRQTVSNILSKMRKTGLIDYNSTVISVSIMNASEPAETNTNPTIWNEHKQISSLHTNRYD